MGMNQNEHSKFKNLLRFPFANISEKFRGVIESLLLKVKYFSSLISTSFYGQVWISRPVEYGKNKILRKIY